MTSRSTPREKRPRKRASSPTQISAELVATICHRLAQNQTVRRTLPGGGRLHIDRQLPFLCVYRRPEGSDDAGTAQLVKGEASYLSAPSAAGLHAQFSTLVREIVRTLSTEFGAFLIVEIWAGQDGGRANDPAIPTVSPRFTIHAPATGALTPSIESLEKHLSRAKVLKQNVKVVVNRDGGVHPADMEPWLTPSEARSLNCSFIGITVPPVYRQPSAEANFPLLARDLRHNLSLALRHTYFEFVRRNTTHQPPHYHSLGRRSVVKAVWEIDRQLAAVSNQFDYLLQLTPVNARRAWKQFQQGGFERPPEFHYRPLPIDPDLLKRDLYKIPVERVEDPALQQIFGEKRNELELKLTMLRDRDTPRFVFESLQLFGGVEDDLLQLAKDLLAKKPALGASHTHDKKRPKVDAIAFAKRAEAEFDSYRQQCPAFVAKARVTDDVNGLMVSRGKLLIGSDLKLAPSRVEALLAHEVGTHLLTYYNGRLQPFQQLYSGLAGYEELQEGLAVLSEYLVGGLTSSRMRQLAARVVAVRALTDGASFGEAFHRLVEDFALSERRAYNVTMRVYRGGGLTKDAVYLRGLEKALQYLQKGGSLNPLFAGKIALVHIPIIKELQYRDVLKPNAIVPRYLQDPGAIDRIKGLRKAELSVVDLIGSFKNKVDG